MPRLARRRILMLSEHVIWRIAMVMTLTLVIGTGVILDGWTGLVLCAAALSCIAVVRKVGRIPTDAPVASERTEAGPTGAHGPRLASATSTGMQRADSAVTMAAIESEHASVLLGPLVDRLEHVVFRMGPEGSLLYLSAAWERLTEYSPRESLGQSLVSHLHPHDREEVQSALSQVSSGRKDHLLSETRLLSGKGTVRWVELRAYTVADAARGTEGAVGTMTDITRRKQAEQALRSSRRHLNTLLANVPGMVYRGRHDRHWTMEFVSDGCIDLTGYEPADIVDNGRIAFGDLIHPDDQEFVWALVETQLAQTKSFQLSYRLVDAAGETKWVWEQGRGVFSSSGDLLALEGFITDVSARRGAEEVARRKLWFDARTGLASRAIFDDRLAFVLDHARVVGYRCTVFWVDVDNFGEVNARYGRDFGDRVLVQFARRFKVIQGPGVTVARVGGDEFALLLTDLRLGGAPASVPAGREFDDAVIRVAETLQVSLSEPLRIDGRELRITGSLGIAVSREGHVSADALLQDARRAATEARAAGAGQWRMANS